MSTYHKEFSANGRTKNVYNKDFPGLTPGVRLEPQSRSDAGTQSEKTACRTTSQKILPRPSDWKTIRKFFLSRPACSWRVSWASQNKRRTPSHTHRQTLAAIFPAADELLGTFPHLPAPGVLPHNRKENATPSHVGRLSRDSRFLATSIATTRPASQSSTVFVYFSSRLLLPYPCDPRQMPHQTHHQQRRTPLHTDDLLLVCFLTCRRAGVAEQGLSPHHFLDQICRRRKKSQNFLFLACRWSSLLLDLKGRRATPNAPQNTTPDAITHRLSPRLFPFPAWTNSPHLLLACFLTCRPARPNKVSRILALSPLVSPTALRRPAQAGQALSSACCVNGRLLDHSRGQLSSSISCPPATCSGR